jgi:hypothetical protein
VVISDRDSSQSEDVTDVETSITNNLAGGDTDNYATVEIPANLELSEGYPSNKVIPNNSKDIEEVRSVIFGDDFFDMLCKETNQ